MTIMGIVLLILGALLFAASFVLTDREQDGKKTSKAMGLKLDRMIDERVEEVKGRLSDVASAAREEEEDKAKRELERLTNEKIMAIDDYSRAVLEEIEKNHKEAMFLYDMLDNKTSDVKNTIRKADAMMQEQESIVSEPTREELFIKDREESKDAMMDLLYKTEDSTSSMSGMDRLKSAAGFSDEDEAPSGAESLPPVEDTEAEGADPELSRNERVLELKKSGLDNVEIAKSLNMGVGEVNLITDLFSGEDKGEESES